MEKIVNKFYLYDRWFNFLKETEEKIVYTSTKKKKNNSIHIEVDKNTKDISVLYLNNNKLLAKLEIKDTFSDSIKLHYQEQEPQQIIINDNTYVNLIIELFTSIDKGRLISDKTVKINKKKKLNKMCYLEPDFPINEEIKLKDINIDSKMFNYFLNLIDYIKGYIKSIETLMEHEENKTYSKFITERKKITIVDELFIYDRNYSFVAKDDKTLHYISHDDGITNLEIKFDPNKYLSSINFMMENTFGSRVTKDLFQIIRNDIGGVTVRFLNRKKSSVRVSGEGFKDYDNAKFKYITVYDAEQNVAYNNVELRANNDEYSLAYHPSLSNVFVDENGNQYRINGQNFSLMDGMSIFAPGIFDNIEKQLIKKAN